MLTRDGLAVTDLDDAEVPVASADLALIKMIQGDMDPRDITRALIDTSPLSPAVIEAAMLRAVPLPSDHYRRILLANSPLPPRVLEMVLSGTPSLMNPLHLAEVIAAQ